jgi:hypothetical protein
MDQPVDHGGGHDGVAENLAAAAEGFVGGYDHRGAFVGGGEQLNIGWRHRRYHVRYGLMAPSIFSQR